MEDVQLEMVIPVQKNLVGLARRPKTARFLKDTWGFPTTFSKKGKTSPRNSSNNSVGTIKHTITHHRITAKVEIAKSKGDDIRWYKPDEIEPNLLSNLDRKAWKLAQPQLSTH